MRDGGVDWKEKESTRLPRRSRTLRRGAVAAFLAIPLVGCFSYEPVETIDPAAGEDVRVRLTGAGRDRLEATSGLARDRLEGRLVEIAPEHLGLMIRLDADRTGFGTQEYVDTVRIARADVREVGVKTLSTSRSVLMGAAVAAIGIGAYAAFTADRSGGGGGDDSDQFILVPVVWLLNGLGAIFGR